MALFFMDKQQILQKAIEKAMNNGWKGWPMYDELGLDTFTTFYLIFSHDFAKAFWGTRGIVKRGDIFDYAHEHDKAILCQEWQHHLQQMVISEDPIEYLSKFI